MVRKPDTEGEKDTCYMIDIAIPHFIFVGASCNAFVSDNGK